MEETIKQDKSKSHNEFEKLLSQDLNNRKFKEGEITTGVVREVGKKFIFLDLGLKSEGAIPIEEFKKTNNKITLKKIEKAIGQRNLIDSTRKFSPLRIPRGAVIVDTSKINKKQMFREIFKIIEDKLLLKYGRNYKTN